MIQLVYGILAAVGVRPKQNAATTVSVGATAPKVEEPKQSIIVGGYQKM